MKAALLLVLGLQMATASAQPPAPTARTLALEAWLTSNPPREELRDAAAKTFLDEGPPALEDLAAHLRAAERAAEDGSTPGRMRLQALQSLAVEVALRFLDRAEQSKMVFAGQFDDLRALQPWAGQLYLNLLLATPEWYPEDRRARLVPALRDLFAQSPGADALARLHDIAADEQGELEDLRRQVSLALWQWGDHEPAEVYLSSLRQGLAGDSEYERLSAQRELARAHYELRAYPAAAGHYRAFLRAAEGVEFRLVPLDYYNAACCASLSGEGDAALDELERGVRLMGSERTDSSLRIERRLFEKDPELDGVRSTSRFRALFAAAFLSPVDEARTPPRNEDKQRSTR